METIHQGMDGVKVLVGRDSVDVSEVETECMRRFGGDRVTNELAITGGESWMIVM